MLISPFDRRKSTPFLVGLIAVIYLLVTYWVLSTKMGPVTADGDDWQFMPSVGMLGHIL